MNKRMEKIRARLEAARESAIQRRIKPELRSALRFICGYRIDEDPEWPGIEFYPTKKATGVQVLRNEDGSATPQELEMFANAPADIAYLLGLFLPVEGVNCSCGHPIHTGEYCDVCSCAAPIEI